MAKRGKRKYNYSTLNPGEGMTYAEIAKEVGYGNASSMRYIYYSAMKKLLKGICENTDYSYNKLSEEQIELIIRSEEFQDRIRVALEANDDEY
jgi:hypothetical protein